jgi:DNA adenine methylase
MYEPVIKWSGSKRSQAENILKYFSKEINTYYEPFCGGASVLRRLLDSDIKVNHYACSDLNKGLIDLWNEIKKHPDLVALHYKKLWNELNADDDKQRKKDYFATVRERYNREHNPLDFMFIMRTTTNGMPRYNRDGEFNNSFHVTRNGIIPDTLEKIIHEWSELLNKNNVEFISCSYEEINPSKEDFLYLDPPYANTKGMYYGCIDYDNFWDWLRSLPCKYVLSFDGISGEEDNTWNVPTDIYSKHEYLLNGNSSFKRTIGKSNNSIVYESLYIK